MNNSNNYKGELIFNLFTEWYDLQSPRFLDFKNYSEQKFTNLWKNWWFAKREQQVYMDTFLDKYRLLLSYNPDQLIPAGLDRKNTIIWKVGWMILWDQIPRNIFRGTATAYATDNKARKIVEELMPDWENLPIPIRVSMILVYIHSEEIADLAITARLLQEIRKPMENYPSVWDSLTGIAGNHSDRMRMFGRIPERNKFLGRESTQAELDYMRSMYL